MAVSLKLHGTKEGCATLDSYRQKVILRNGRGILLEMTFSDFARICIAHIPHMLDNNLFGSVSDELLGLLPSFAFSRKIEVEGLDCNPQFRVQIWKTSQEFFFIEVFECDDPTNRVVLDHLDGRVLAIFYNLYT